MVCAVRRPALLCGLRWWAEREGGNFKRCCNCCGNRRRAYGRQGEVYGSAGLQWAATGGRFVLSRVTYGYCFATTKWHSGGGVSGDRAMRVVCIAVSTRQDDANLSAGTSYSSTQRPPRTISYDDAFFTVHDNGNIAHAATKYGRNGDEKAQSLNEVLENANRLCHGYSRRTALRCIATSKQTRVVRRVN